MSQLDYAVQETVKSKENPESAPEAASSEMVARDSLEGQPLPQDNFAGKRVGGWLLLFCITSSILGPVLSSESLRNSLFSMDDDISWYFIIFLLLGQIAVGIYVWNLGRYALRILQVYFIGEFSGGIWFLALGLYEDIRLLGTYEDFGHGPQPLTQGIAVYHMQIGFGFIVASFLWWLYFRRSKRVRSTFGRNI
jgi:hypothetical protein